MGSLARSFAGSDKKSPAECFQRGLVSCDAYVEMSSVCVQPGRPAGAGMMMVPVDVLRAEHRSTDYRPASGAVKFAGVDAFELSTRVSLTP